MAFRSDFIDSIITKPSRASESIVGRLGTDLGMVEPIDVVDRTWDGGMDNHGSEGSNSPVDSIFTSIHGIASLGGSSVV